MVQGRGGKEAEQLKILVFSDSHGNTSFMEQAVEAERPDQILHLGDVVRDARALAERFPHIPLTYVYGNCDGLSAGEQAERVLELEGKRILMLHGHTRGVKAGIGGAVWAAREAEADVVLFGHTHEPLCDRAGPLWVVNPGSVRGYYLTTYAVITMEADGTLECHIVRMDKQP